MKRLTAAVAAIGLVATGAVVTVSGAASAAPENPANLVVSPPPSDFDDYGAKKAILSWDDWSTTNNAVDAYWVFADRDGSFITLGDPNYGPNGGDRIAVVSKNTLQLRADDLTAGKNYHFAVYAIDSAGDVLPPDGAVADTPIGYVLGAGYNLSIKTSRTTVLSGKVIELSGTLTAANGSPLPNKTITIFRDPYPKSVEMNTKTTEVTTTTGGKWSFKTKPRINGRYWARYIPADGIGGWTKTVAIDVRAAISLRVKPDTTIRYGRDLIFRGQVSGSPSLVAGSKICWQSTASGSWGGGSCGVIKDDGSYVLRVKQPGKDADGKYRVYSTDLAPYYVASRSKPVKITIR